MILAAYLGRRYLRAFAFVALAFVAILFLIDIIEEIRRFGEAGLARTSWLAGLSVVGALYAILPLVGLLGGIALFLGLSRSSELVAMRAAGRSGLRIMAAPATTALLLGVLAVAGLNPIVAATTKRYDAASARIGAGSEAAVSLGKGAVWLRQGIGMGDSPSGESQGTAAGQIVIRAARASADATTLYDATFFVFEAPRGLVTRIEAQSARLVQGAWQISGARRWPLDAENPAAAVETLPGLTLPTDLTAARIRDGFGAPLAIPVWQLPRFIDGLERAGFSGLRHRVWLWQELARPAMMAAMVMLAASFTMRPARGRRTGVLVLLAFAAGIGLFFLRNLAQVLAEAGQVPPPMAALAPPLIAALLALTTLLRLEDG